MVLVVLLLLVVAGVYHRPFAVQQTTGRKWSDPQMFQAVVTRMALGGTYYEAMGAELRAGDYSIRSVFNWRPPLLYAGFAYSRGLMRGLLFALVGILLLATFAHACRLPPAAGVSMVLLQFGTGGFLITPLGQMFTEAWVGALLALAVLAYAHRWHVVAAALILVSLFMRELAAPFAVVCGPLAAANRRWREVAVWILGGIALLAYYAWHWQMVQSHTIASDPTQIPAWVRFGGMRFILMTIAFGGWVVLCPPWIVGFACAFIVASFWSPAPRHLKLAVLTYFMFFAAVGQPVNRYWGLLTAPTWAVAIGYGVLGVQALWTRARSFP